MIIPKAILVEVMGIALEVHRRRAVAKNIIPLAVQAAQAVVAIPVPAKITLVHPVHPDTVPKIPMMMGMRKCTMIHFFKNPMTINILLTKKSNNCR